MIWSLWGKFIVAALCLLFFGYKASKLAYNISKISFFSQTFMGMIFLAISTSMPEMFASIGAAGVAKSVNLAAGNVFGTLVINLMVLVIIDIQINKSAIVYGDKQHILTGILSVVLLGAMVISILLQSLISSVPYFLNIGLDSFILIFICLICLRMVFRYEKEHKIKFSPKLNKFSNNSDTIKIWSKFFIYIFLVGGAGIWISVIADKIAAISTWCNHTFFGSIFLALSSSFPEIIVSIFSAAVGSVSMAIGNILGSNLFDTIIIPLSDIFYQHGPIFDKVSLVHVFTAITAIVMTSIVITGLIYKTKRKLGRLNWFSISMILLFLTYYFFLVKLTV